MALISQAAVGIHTDVTRCTVGHNGIFSRRNNLEASRMKKTCVSFSSSSCYSDKIAQVLHPNNARVGIRRGHGAIVAAVVGTEPLTKEDLIGHLASGCKPKEKWRYLN